MLKTIRTTSSTALMVFVMAGASLAADLIPIELPDPVTSGGRPLMDVLKDRQTTREFSQMKLPLQTLSNLLWAAWGLNRPDGRRTAPSASNMQEIDIYVVLEEGTYLYDAKEHVLVPHKAGDYRAATGQQDFPATAPLNLVYVADYARMGNRTDENKLMTSSADTGFIGQNVYVFCSSEGLGTVVRGLVDREALKETLGLRPGQHVTYAQSVGYISGE